MLTSQGNPIQEQAVFDVIGERLEQDEKWGVQNHDSVFWLSILVEEVGELAKEINDSMERDDIRAPAKLRDELVQVAAVALAMVECCDRNKWCE